MKDLYKLEEKFTDDKYAQKFYAALCNNVWIHKTRPKNYKELQEKQWTSKGPFKSFAWEFGTSWRGAGDVVATIRNVGEGYLDFYCSGITGNHSSPEGEVDEEIVADLNGLGWELDEDHYDRLDVVHKYENLNNIDY
jgi:hypothetical protein